MIEAFQCTYRVSCPFTAMAFPSCATSFLQRTSIDGYVFRVHFVPFYLSSAFDSLKRAGSVRAGSVLPMLPFHAKRPNPGVKCRPAAGAATEPLSWNKRSGKSPGHSPASPGSDGEGWFAEHFENIGECYFLIVPAEIHPMAGSMACTAFGGQGKAAFPFHDYFPCFSAPSFHFFRLPIMQAMRHSSFGGSGGHSRAGLDRFETEYFDKRPPWVSLWKCRRA